MIHTDESFFKRRVFIMTSPTNLTKRKRKAKEIKKGAHRKRKLRKEGTTPQLFTWEKPSAEVSS